VLPDVTFYAIHLFKSKFSIYARTVVPTFLTRVIKRIAKVSYPRSTSAPSNTSLALENPQS